MKKLESPKMAHPGWILYIKDLFPVRYMAGGIIYLLTESLDGLIIQVEKTAKVYMYCTL